MALNTKAIGVAVVVIIVVVIGVLVSQGPKTPFSPSSSPSGPLQSKPPVPDDPQAILKFISEADDRAQKFEALNKLKTTVPPPQLAAILTTILPDPDPDIRANIIQTIGNSPIINSVLSTLIERFVNGDQDALTGIVSVIQDWPSDGSTVPVTPPACNQNDFLCQDWSTCQGGQQTRTCNKINQACKGDPVLTQSCTDTCSPDWSCSNWPECADSKQSRTCTDNNNCGILAIFPASNQDCTTPPKDPDKPKPNCPPDSHPIYKLIESSSVDIKVRCSLYASLGACISKIKNPPDCGHGPDDGGFLINNWPIEVGEGGDPKVEIIEPEDGYWSEEETDINLKVDIKNLILQPPGGLIGAKSIAGKLFKEGHLKVYLDGKEIYTGKNKGGLTTSHTLTIPVLGLEPWPDGSAREYLIRAEIHAKTHLLMVVNARGVRIVAVRRSPKPFA